MHSFETLERERFDIKTTRERAFDDVCAVVGTRFPELSNYLVDRVWRDERTVRGYANEDIRRVPLRSPVKPTQHVRFAAPDDVGSGHRGVSLDDVVWWLSGGGHYRVVDGLRSGDPLRRRARACAFHRVDTSLSPGGVSSRCGPGL